MSAVPVYELTVKMFTPDWVTPDQFQDLQGTYPERKARADRQRSWAHTVWMAVLDDALWCAASSGSAKLRDEALAWIEADGRDVGGFRWVCDVLGHDPDVWGPAIRRAAVRATIPEDAADWRVLPSVPDYEVHRDGKRVRNKLTGRPVPIVHGWGRNRSGSAPTVRLGRDGDRHYRSLATAYAEAWPEACGRSRE